MPFMRRNRFLRKPLLAKHFSQMKRTLGSESYKLRQVAAEVKGLLYTDEQ
jgi:hypothetical protein